MTHLAHYLPPVGRADSPERCPTDHPTATLYQSQGHSPCSPSADGSHGSPVTNCYNLFVLQGLISCIVLSVQQIINHLEIAHMTPIVFLLAETLIAVATIVAIVSPVALFVAILRA